MVADSKRGKKEQEKYYKELTADILNDEYCVHIFLGDAKKAQRKLKNWYPDVSESSFFEGYRGFQFANREVNPSIWVGLEPDDPHFFATLAHEAVHAIDHIFEKISERDAPEIYAHSVAAVVAKVEAWVKKQTGKR